MVFICLVSLGGFGESFSAGGRPRLFLALELPSSLLDESLSWRLLRLRFFQPDLLLHLFQVSILNGLELKRARAKTRLILNHLNLSIHDVEL